MMKKVLLVVSIALLAIGCNQAEKKEDGASGKDAAMHTLYQENVASLKTFIADFEKEDLDGQAAMIADSAVWISPMYGDTIHTKKHWLESLKYYMDNWSNLHLSNAQFLPGVDSATLEFDGSVRYYGDWEGTYSTGEPTKVKFYGSYEFNKDHKLISGDDFFDIGGLLNEVKAAKK